MIPKTSGFLPYFWKKKDIISKTDVPLERFETIVHPSASVSKMAKLAQGTVVLRNVTTASNVNIGNHVMVLPNTVISHDDSISDYSCVGNPAKILRKTVEHKA